jgi:hypothetical protein
VTDQHDSPAVYSRKAANDCRIFAVGAIAGERDELIGHSRHIILEVRPLRMARHLRLLPRRKLRICVLEELRSLAFELADLGFDIDLAVVSGFLQLPNARLKLGNRLFEIQVRQLWEGA